MEDEKTVAKEKFNEKRKWQIALRRYVLEKQISYAYAPYFGLDIETLRNWFEASFTDGMNWENFGKEWQFEHIVPLNLFDFNNENDLKLCWNFINLRAERKEKQTAASFDKQIAKAYFQGIFDKTGFVLCKKMIEKIESFENVGINTEIEADFIKQHSNLIEKLYHYGSFEFELLNRGRNIEDVEAEREILKRFGH